MFRIDNLFPGMAILLELFVQKDFFYQLVLYVAVLLKLLPGIVWNHCPDSNGISVRNALENMHSIVRFYVN